jgi:magnesium and cobalt transporter
MKDDQPSNGSAQRSWFGRLSQSILGEPRNLNDILGLLRDAQARGVLPADVLTMIEGALQVSDLRVRDIMIPRAQMTVVRRDASLDLLLPVIVESGHSRFPVIGETRDEIVGILLAKDLLRFVGEGQREAFNVKEVMRPAAMIPESKRLNDLLREFRASRNHMAIVVDEYGGVAGLVTIEDVLEQIVGEIDDEHDFSEDEGDIRRHGKHRFTVKARTTVEDFNGYFGAELSDAEFDTVGGLVTHALGHLPERGEAVRIGNFDFKVLRADSRRLHLLRVTPLVALKQASG